MKVMSLILLAICILFASADSKFDLFESNDFNINIIGGKDAEEGQFPYQVSLRNKFSRAHFCGASILSGRFLLTAAHCTQGMHSSPLFVYAVIGSINLNGGVSVQLDKITPHENFFVSRKDVRNDISLIRTAQQIVFTKLIQPIALPSQDTEENTDVIVSGWGRSVS